MVIGVIVGAIVLLLALLFFIYCGIEQQNVVLIITAGVVSWYAWETREMRKEMVHQTIIQSTPFISIFIKKTPVDAGKFEFEKLWVRNDGEGTARKIAFEALEPFSDEEVVSFKPIEILPIGGEKRELIIEWKSKATGEITKGPSDILTQMYLAYLEKESVIKKFRFKLKYKNIINDIYHADVTFRYGEFLIADPVKVKSSKL